ncbi:Ldh family oxidoreductase [Candidimonas sp. SYP-B2681]|uniref:Ldh family oxidoreductase n=1 Tax=Candidimonas sp. SYP-B2681 TaxID=2497686 RepID=UPI000F87B155|nr:Ldh family oxidoreductase [Candidimonas sp. SYP-B2681]RTZ41524.1 Ldh family oxidoreductase [Candidimonas sp. SYP-B2681]
MNLIDANTPEKIRLTVDDAVQLGESALKGIGYTEDEARVITHHLLDNSLCGYEFAGLPRILAIANSPELQKPRYPVKVIHETPVSALLDGGNHVGYISVNAAAELAIQKVATSGIAVVGVANSWFSGRNAYYLEKIARAGYVGIHTVSGSPMVVPIGAKRPALGTNPIAFAFPGQVDPFIFDMGTGATMWGEVLLHAFLEKDFPEVVGVDANGAPTKNAKEIVNGGVIPFAGHKGYGLSLAVQALGLLAGAKMRAGNVSDFGFLFIAFDPEIMMPAAEFKAQLAELLQNIKNLPRQDGVDEIRIPSERSCRERELRREQGILLQRRVYDQLMEMQAVHG